MLNLGVIAPVDRPHRLGQQYRVEQGENRQRRSHQVQNLLRSPPDLNKWVKREHYCPKTVDEVVTELNGAKFFTIFDAKKGYLHVPLDEQSSYLTTFSIPFGRYHFRRLPFILALLFPKKCFKNGSTQHLKAAMASPVSLTTHLYMDHPKLSTTET